MKEEDKNKTPEEILKDLVKLKQAADESQSDIRDFQHRVAVFATETAFELYPELKEMDSKHILHFGDLITRQTCTLALDIDNFVYHMTEEK